jgi:cell division protein FtsA
MVRNGSVEGTRMFALGGRAFSKSLADRLDIGFEDAEQVKIDHAHGREVADPDEVTDIVSDDVAVWAAGVELVLEEFGQEGLLPGRIELCGGGAALPEIRAALEAETFATHVPFARRPQISMMEPGSVSDVSDATGLLVDQQDVTPMALAFQAVEASHDREPLDAALQRVLKGMRV